jgi:PAS domain S-box-containing protein
MRGGRQCNAAKMSPANDKQECALRRTVIGAACFVTAFGIAMAALWLSSATWPEALLPGFFYMKFNTSLAFIGAGTGLLAASRRSKRYTLFAGSFVLFIGGGTLLQYLTGVSFGFDELFLNDRHYSSNPYPGRMAPGSALALTCAGMLFLLAANDTRARPWGIVAIELLGFLVFAVGAECLIGHLQNVSHAYSWGSYARMPLPAALGFTTLGIGLMALTWHRQDTHTARMPLWVPALLCFVVLMADIATPRGVAMGIAYVPLVFCSLWFNRPHAGFVFAAIATVLGVLAIFAKAPSDVESWVVTTNRIINLGAVWFVAVLIYLHRKSEAAFKQSESRLSAVFNHALDGMISINAHGIIDHFNPACERIFGYEASEVLGRNINMLMPEPYHSEHDGYLARYLSTGEAHIIGTTGREVTARRKDGSIFPMDLSISAFQLGDNQHFSGIIRDITARKEAEMKLLRYTSALERSNQDLDDFAYIASHDLKEPLRGLFNNAAFLQEDYCDKLDEVGIRRLRRLGYLSQRMELLIDDLLYFSRLGRQDMAVKVTDLNAVIDNVSSMMEATLKEQNAFIAIPRPLPQTRCDQTRVTEVFRNLISNAVKYNDSNQKIIEIGYVDRMSTKRGLEQQQVFYVKDNGVGIEQEFYEEIFRIFKRLNQEDDGKKGTGVGLTFVRKIIDRHGGQIWLESEPGKGTTFYFTLEGIAYGAAAA